MRVTFHMGAHKTASSLIQHRLRRVGTTFAGRRLLFMDNDAVLGTAWGDWCRRERGDGNAALGSFAGQIEAWRAAGADHVILSSEGFLGGITMFDRGKLYPDAAAVLARLGVLLAGTGHTVDIRPLYYVRRTDRFLESCLSQRLSLGKDLDPRTAFDDDRLATLSWRPVIEAIERAVGRPIAVRRFEDLTRVGPADFVAGFLAACGLPAPHFVERQVTLGRAAERLPRWLRERQPFADFLRPNAGLSVRGSEMSLRLRPLVSKEEWRTVVRPFLRRNFSAARDKTGGIRAPDNVARQLRRTYEADCDWLGDRLTLSCGDTP